MSRQISVKSKIAQGRCKGEGAQYKPWITTSDFNSLGTTSVIKDWKTGRSVHCLSQGEALWYYILRWDDNNIDIREQFYLDNRITLKIAQATGIQHPGNNRHIMTTDFVVTKADGSLHAYSIKPNRNISERTMQILYIEKIYWMNKQAKFDLLFKTDANKILASNIRLITEFYDQTQVFDKYSAIKHKIAIKEYCIDMETVLIDNQILDKVLENNA